MPIINVEINNHGVATALIDLPAERYNLLTPALLSELSDIISRAEQDAEIKALVLISGKAGGFIAGADISMFLGIHTAADGAKLSRTGQQLFSRLFDLRKPVICAINGLCMGGGLELALNCHYRIASDSNQTVLALPEVKLGILPAATGTQRLIRLIPLDIAMDKLLTGKSTYAAKAKAIGLVDEVVPTAMLRQIAADRAQKLIEGKLKLNRPSWPLPTGEALAAAVKSTRAMVQKQTKGVYPAPLKIVDAVEAGLINGLEAGFAAEATGFGELLISREARSLIHIFFASKAVSKDIGIAADVKPQPVTEIGILGAGLMGAGIAAVSVDNGYRVLMKDREPVHLGKGVAYAAEVLTEKYQKRKNGKLEITRGMDLLSSTIDYRGFKQVDFLIEAVFEDPKLKHQVIREVEPLLPEHAIFASNTSAIPITHLMQASIRPERFIGMHFFSPVHKMPLVEIIVTDKTSPETIATTVAVTKRYGKTPIVVNDGFGFYTSRVIARYIIEAYWALAEGHQVDEIDAAAVKVGFPVGPITVTDEVGIDVAEKAGKQVEPVFGSRMSGPEFLLSKVIADNRLGRKNGRGFYLYNQGKKGAVDQTVYALLPGGYQRKQADQAKIATRFLYAFVNESAFCLQENILRTPRDGDVGSILGIGFPPNLGGPFHFADVEGLTKVVDTLHQLAEEFGERFVPAPLLVEMAKAGKTFYQTR